MDSRSRVGERRPQKGKINLWDAIELDARSLWEAPGRLGPARAVCPIGPVPYRLFVGCQAGSVVRTKRTPVVIRNASQTRKPSPATPNRAMVRPSAMVGPAMVPTISKAAPTGASQVKGFGVMPAAIAARDRPSSANAMETSRTVKMLLCRAHSAWIAPRSGLVHVCGDGECLLGRHDEGEHGVDAEGSYEAEDCPASTAGREEVSGDAAEEEGQADGAEDVGRGQDDRDRPVAGVVRQHPGGGGAVARCGSSANDVLGDHDEGEGQRSPARCSGAEVGGPRLAVRAGSAVLDLGLEMGGLRTWWDLLTRLEQ